MSSPPARSAVAGFSLPTILRAVLCCMPCQSALPGEGEALAVFLPFPFYSVPADPPEDAFFNRGINAKCEIDFEYGSSSSFKSSSSRNVSIFTLLAIKV